MSDRGSGDHIEQTNIHNARDVVGKVESHAHHHHPPLKPPPEDDESWRGEANPPPVQAACFQQRGLVGELVQAVDSGGTAVLTQVLSGMGGVGKTQLAIQYSEHAWSAGKVNFRTWITAVSREAITSAYATAAEALGLVPYGSDPERACRRFLAWLDTTTHRWLVVLDDLQDPRHLKDLWPPRRPGGRTVVTTRRQDPTLRGGQRQVLQVGLFGPEEAEAYLHRKLDHDPAATHGAAELAADLGYLPLALAQAAAYIALEDTTCAAYRQQFHDRQRGLAELVPDARQDALPDDYDHAVAATWSLSIERANERTPVGLARPLLELASVLDPNGIPIEIFTTETARTFLRAGNVPTADEVTKALRNLRLFSLVDIRDRNREAAKPGMQPRDIRIHTLVQRVIRDTISDLETTARTAADALLQTWPIYDSHTSLSRSLRANTETLHQHAQDSLYAPKLHPVLWRTGRMIGEEGFSTDAASYFVTLADRSQRAVGPNHSDTLAARNEIAYWSARAGHAITTAASLEKLLHDMRRALGPDHPNTLVTRHDLADTCGHAGYWSAADVATNLKNLLDDMLRVLDPHNPSVLETRRNIARWQARAGHARAAAAALETLLPTMLRVLGPNHPNTLITRYELAENQGLSGYWSAADVATNLKNLLDDMLRVLEPDNPSVLGIRHSLAYWQARAGHARAAAAALETLLPTMLRVLGPNHPNTLVTQHNIACLQEFRQR